MRSGGGLRNDKPIEEDFMADFPDDDFEPKDSTPKTAPPAGQSIGKTAVSSGDFGLKKPGKTASKAAVEEDLMADFPDDDLEPPKPPVNTLAPAKATDDDPFAEISDEEKQEKSKVATVAASSSLQATNRYNDLGEFSVDMKRLAEFRRAGEFVSDLPEQDNVDDDMIEQIVLRDQVSSLTLLLE